MLQTASALEQANDEDLAWVKNALLTDLEINTAELSKSRKKLWTLKPWLRLINGNIYLSKEETDGRSRLLYMLPKQMARAVIEQLHSTVFNGHLGINKTEARVMERFFWESLRRDVREFVKECNKCQLNKNTQLPLFGELKPIDTSRPGQI